MISDGITKIDFQILDWIQSNLKCDALDWLAPKYSFLGNGGWFFILIAVLLLLTKKYRKQGGYLAIAYALGFLFGNIIIKNAVARVRPYDQVQGIVLLVDKLKDYSFPSGHTLVAFEFCSVICLLPIKKIYKIFAVLVAVAMAMSRLYLYVHFPSDVLVGAILGSIFGLMGTRILDMIIEERKEKTLSIQKNLEAEEITDSEEE